jgi:hypothetical protein
MKNCNIHVSNILAVITRAESAEDRASSASLSIGKWLDTLRKVRELQPSIVVPGDSKVGAALDASTAVDFTDSYLLAFNEELKTAKDPEDLINAMREKFPSAGLLLALERGAKANVERRQTD